jgi:hypothetical protein
MPYRSLLLVTAALLAILINFYTYENKYNGPPIRSDGWGYYAHLPALFIHMDPFYNFVDGPHPNEVTKSNFGVSPGAGWGAGLSPVECGYLNKYPVGTAMLQAPFFLVALIIAQNTQDFTFGFEEIFQYANVFSALVYMLAGIFLLARTAETLCAKRWAYALLAFSVFATNLLLYGSYDGSFSHIYGFFLGSAAVFLVFSGRCSLGSMQHHLLLGVTIGLATIVRPTNIIWVALLLVNPSTNLRRITLDLAMFGLGFAVAVAPQLVLWYVTTGNVLHYSYGAEGFDFSSPQVMDFLFSVRKGMFFWHPAYFFLFLAAVIAALTHARRAVVPLAIVILTIYVSSSWHAWYFGGSFGSRPAIDVLPFLVVGAALVLKDRKLTRSQAGLFTVFALLMIAVNLIQMHGYIVRTIPFDGTTWETYISFWHSLLHGG